MSVCVCVCVCVCEKVKLMGSPLAGETPKTIYEPIGTGK